MARYTGWKQERKALDLPITATITLRPREDGKFVAHALDFDLVAVADTEKEAEQEVRLAVKLYIEYGLIKGWEKDIRFSAPQCAWDLLTPDAPIRIGEPIHITDHRAERKVIVYRHRPTTVSSATHASLQTV